MKLINPDFENRFTYHSPRGGQTVQCDRIRRLTKELAYVFEEECPGGVSEYRLALVKLEEAMFWAQAAIARHGTDQAIRRERHGDEDTPGGLEREKECVPDTNSTQDGPAPADLGLCPELVSVMHPEYRKLLGRST